MTQVNELGILEELRAAGTGDGSGADRPEGFPAGGGGGQGGGRGAEGMDPELVATMQAEREADGGSSLRNNRFGVPLIEGQSVEAIPVTTAIANHKEILGANGTCGLLLHPTVKVGDVNNGTEVKIASNDAVDGAIRWGLENPDEAAILGKRGRVNVLKRFDLTNTSNQWLNLYDSMLGNDYDMDKVAEDNVFDL